MDIARTNIGYTTDIEWINKGYSGDKQRINKMYKNSFLDIQIRHISAKFGNIIKAIQKKCKLWNYRKDRAKTFFENKRGKHSKSQ